jgi:ribonuclease P protein component
MNSGAQRFPKKVRLLRQFEFDRVYQGNAYAADETLVVMAVSNQRDITRIGLSVSRKVGNAVVRNRWKRIIREAFRRQQTKLPHGLDIVVRPRMGARCEFNKVHASLATLISKVDHRIRKSMAPQQDRVRE